MPPAKKKPNNPQKECEHLWHKNAYELASIYGLEPDEPCPSCATTSVITTEDQPLAALNPTECEDLWHVHNWEATALHGTEPTDACPTCHAKTLWE